MCQRLGCGIFALDPPLLRFIEDKLHGLTARVAEGSKFTIDYERIDELEAQIAHVGRLHQQLAQRTRAWCVVRWGLFRSVRS